jgi:hypothetical protein
MSDSLSTHLDRKSVVAKLRSRGKLEGFVEFYRRMAWRADSGKRDASGEGPEVIESNGEVTGGGGRRETGRRESEGERQRGGERQREAVESSRIRANEQSICAC